MSVKSKSLYSASMFAVFGVFLGSVLSFPSWAMEPEDRSSLTQSRISSTNPSQVQLETVEKRPLLKIGQNLLSKEESSRIYNYISDAGYNGKDFDFTKFSKWFCSKFLGYTGKELGFDESGRPTLFNTDNLDSAATFDYHLNFLKDKRVHINSNMISGPRAMDENYFHTWVEKILKDIPSNLEKVLPSHVFRDAEVREPLETKDGHIYLSNGALANFDTGTTYAVNTKGKIFIPGFGGGYRYHPDLLKGKSAWCAGTMGAIDGKIDYLYENSGHYLPTLYHYYTFVEFLQNGNFFTPTAELQVLRAGSKQMNVEQFLASYNKEDLRSLWVEEAKKNLNYTPFLKIVVSKSLSES